MGFERDDIDEDGSSAPDARAIALGWRAGGLVFGLALILRAAFLFELARTPFFDVLLGDSLGYHVWAVDLAGGDWIGSGVFYQAPLYPYAVGVLYSVFGPSPLAASCGLLASAATRFFSSRRVGLLAGLLASLYAPAIFFVALVQKATLGLFFTSLALELLSRVMRHARSPAIWGALGVVLGLLALTRENALVFPPLVVLWLLLRHRRSGARRVAMWLAVFVIGVSAPLVGVGLRNLVVGGEFALTTSQFGTNFFIGNNANARGFYIPLRLNRGNVVYERDDAVALAERTVGRSLSPAEVSAFWTGQALDYIRSQPLDWLALMGRKALLVWNHVEASDTEDIAVFRHFSFVLDALARVFHFGLVVPLAAAGVWLTRDRWRELWVLYAMIAVYAASLTIFFLFARYRVPLVPLSIVFAAVGADEAIQLARGRGGGWRSQRVTLAIAAAAAIVAALPLTDTETQMAATWKNLGGAMLESGRPAEAIPLFEKSLVHRPDGAEAMRGIAEALAHQGRLAASRAAFERVLAHDPDDPLALLGLGQVQLLEGRTADGLRSLEAATKAAPEDPRAWYRIGMHHAHAGAPAAAIPWLRAAAERETDGFGARLELAKALYQTGDRDAARTESAWIVRRDPENLGATLLLADLLESDGRIGRARALARRALVIDPGNPIALRQLARLRLRSPEASGKRGPAASGAERSR
jgi:tetratricopeptide (TPR) repeat protein